MPPLICPYKCTGDFEGGLHACSCKSQPICNSLVGHTAPERLLYDATIDAIADYIRNNQAAAYINDEKNAREPRNLSIPIPVIPLIPWRHHRDLTSGIRTNRAFNPANSAEKSSVALVRFSDESEGEDYSFYSDDSMDQETSQSLIPHSQTRVSDSSIAESSQSIIPHSEEQGLRLTEVNPGKGDVVEIHMRKGRDGRLHTSRGRVMQVDPDHPNRVKTHTCRS